MTPPAKHLKHLNHRRDYLIRKTQGRETSPENIIQMHLRELRALTWAIEKLTEITK